MLSKLNAPGRQANVALMTSFTGQRLVEDFHGKTTQESPCLAAIESKDLLIPYVNQPPRLASRRATHKVVLVSVGYLSFEGLPLRPSDLRDAISLR